MEVNFSLIDELGSSFHFNSNFYPNGQNKKSELKTKDLDILVNKQKFSLNDTPENCKRKSKSKIIILKLNFELVLNKNSEFMEVLRYIISYN